MDPTRVRDALRKLAASPTDVIGAMTHGFRLRPPRPEPDVAAFEARHRIVLPGDYREFITGVGDGGAGPCYGFFPLGSMDDVHTADELRQWQEGDGFVGVLSRPFPLREPWNDLAGMPADDLSDTNEDEFARQMDAFDERYWDTSRVDGAMPIAHLGCALRVWLVVTGPEAGYLWQDNRGDYTGLAPLMLRNGDRATFATWYAEWLEGALLAPPAPIPASPAGRLLARAKRWLRRQRQAWGG